MREGPWERQAARRRAALLGKALEIGIRYGKGDYPTRPSDFSLAPEFHYFVVYPERNIKRPKVRAFRDWLHSEVRRLENDAA